MKSLVLMTVGCLTLAGMASGEDWPQWRGLERNGISTEKGWFKEGAAGRVVWERKVGAGYPAVAVKGGRLFTLGNADGQDTVVCLDARTGNPIWKYAYPCAAGDYPGPRSSPAVDADSVYVMSREAKVFCLDSASGTCRWQRDLKADLKVALPQWGVSGSPVLEGAMVFVNVGSNGMAMDRKTGVTKWQSGGTGGGYATPVVTSAGGSKYLIVLGAKAIVGADLQTGRRLWEHPWQTRYDVNAPDPIVVDSSREGKGGRILITSGYGRGGALLDVSAEPPKVVWENQNLSSHVGTPVVDRGYAYGGHGYVNRGGTLRCIELQTGAVKWEFGGLGYCSLLLADGKLLIQGEKGVLAVADATPEKYQELWRKQVLDGICWTMPVLSDGLVYCRNDAGRLVCVDMKTP